MASSNLSTRFTRIGDEVAFRMQIDGNEQFMTCNGFVESHAFMKELPDGPAEECVFEIHSARSYTSAMQYAEQLRVSGYDETQVLAMQSKPTSSIDDGSELSSWKWRAAQEAKNNLYLQERNEGQEIRYGQIIQLYHVSSQKYLTVDPDTTAKTDESSMGVTVDDEGPQSWFRIMPRHKLHNEGELIHKGEQIVLVNVTSQALLCIDRNATDEYDEVVARGDEDDTSSSGFVLHSYKSYMPTEVRSAYISCGSVLRLYFKDFNGFLTLSGERPLLLEDDVDQDTRPTSTLFKIEGMDPTRASPVEWGQHIKLKHVGEGTYLCYQANEDGTDTVTSTDDPTAEGARFVLDAFYESDNKEDQSFNPVKLQSLFRLRPAATNVYLSINKAAVQSPASRVTPVDESSAKTDKMMGVQAAKTDVHYGVQTTAEKQEQDTLVAIICDDIGEMMATRKVLTVKRALSNYVQVFHKEGKRPNMNFCKLVRGALQSMVFFVQKVPIEKLRLDPLTVDERPNKPKQDLMADQGLLTLIIETIDAPFSSELMTLEQVGGKARNKKLKIFWDIGRVGYYLLLQCLKQNIKAKAVLSNIDTMTLMTSHLGFEMKAAATLMTLFKNNPLLIHKVDEPSVQIFVDLISNRGKKERYMNFVLALLRCNGSAVVANQELVRELLVMKNLEQCMINIKPVDKLSFQVDALSSNTGGSVSRNWVSMEGFLSNCSEETFAFFIKMLECYAELCFGRNNDSIRYMVNVFPFKHLTRFVCKRTQHSDAAIEQRFYFVRAAFSKLIECLYIDVDPHKEVAKVRTTRKWRHFDVSLMHSEHAPKRLGGTRIRNSAEIGSGGPRAVFMPAAEPNSTDIESVDDIGGEAGEHPNEAFLKDVNFTDLKRFLLENLKLMYVQDSQLVGQNRFFAATLQTLEKLLQFGFFVTVDEVTAILQPLKKVLDGSDDKSHAGDRGPTARLLAEEANRDIVEAKVAAIRVIEVLMTLRDDFRLGLMLRIFEKWVDENRFKSRISGDVRAHPDFGDSHHRVSSQLDFDEVLGYMTMVSSDGSQSANKASIDLLPEILDLMSYEDPSLMTKALAFLMDSMYQEQSLHEAVVNTRILVSDNSVKVFNEASAWVDLITAVTQDKMAEEQEELVISTMGSIEKLFLNNEGELEATHQQILRDVHVHDVCHRLLHLPFSNTPEEARRREIFLLAYRVLKLFAERNSTNQSILLPHVPFYMTQMGAKLKAANVLTEIFRDNRSVCTQVSEETIRQLVAIIADKGRYPRYLKMLQTIMIPDHHPIPRVQELVLRAMNSRHNTLSHLWNDPEGMALRTELLAKEEHKKKAEGDLNYHVELLKTMSAMVSGVNMYTIVRCKALLSLPAIMDHLEEELPLFLRIRYVDFLRACYCFGDRNQFDEFTVANLWTIAGTHMVSVLKQCKDEYTGSSDVEANAVSAVAEFLQEFFNNPYTSAIQHADDAAAKACMRALAEASEEIQLDTIQAEHVMSGAKAILNNRAISKGTVTQAMLPKIAKQTKARPGTKNTVAKKAKPGAKVTAAMVERAVQGALTDFGTQFEAFWGLKMSRNAGRQARLINCFADPNPDRTEEAPSTAHDLESMNLSEGNLLLSKLFLATSDMSSSTQLKKRTLEMLVRLAQFEDDFDRVTVTMSQNRLDKVGEVKSSKQDDSLMGATRMALGMLISPAHQDVRGETYDLLNALLDGGNTQVQERVYSFLSSYRGQKFMQEAHHNMRKGKDELAELVSFEKRLQEVQAILSEEDAVTASQVTPTMVLRYHCAKLLTLIQNSCEGHLVKMQDIWREQPLSSQSFNVVAEITEYFEAAVKLGVDEHSYPYTMGCLNALIDLMQGPCKDNQKVVACSKLPQCCNSVCQLPEFEGCSLVQVYVLKSLVATCLSSVIESNTDRAVTSYLASEISASIFCTVANQAGALVSKDETLYEDITDEVSAQRKTAYEVYNFLSSLSSEAPDLGEDMDRFLYPDIRKKLDKNTGRIEIRMPTGELARVCFRLPALRKNLGKQVVEAIQWGVNRSSPTVQLEDFMSLAHNMEVLMKHRHGLGRSKVLSYLTDDKVVYFLNYSSVFMAIVLNICMVESYKSKDETSVSKTIDLYPEIFALAFVLFLIEAVRFAQFLLGELPVIFTLGPQVPIVVTALDRVQQEIERLDLDTIRVPIIKRRVKTVWLMDTARLLLTVVCSGKIWMEAFLASSACQGILDTPLWFAAHLTVYTVEMFKDVQSVLTAITANWKALVASTMFGVVVTYTIALWGFMKKPEYFPCSSLRECTVIQLMAGWRNADVIMTDEGAEAAMYADTEMIFISMAYYSTIAVTMLYIIFGIIVDGFVELREEKNTTMDKIQNKCFVCDIDRQTFDRYSDGGFFVHTKYEHKWENYLLFLIMLGEKDGTELTGPEKYVWEQYMAKKVDWFPINAAMSLDAYRRKEDEKTSKVENTIMSTAQATTELYNSTRDMYTHILRIEDALVASTGKKLSSAGSTMQRSETVLFAEGAPKL